MRPSLRELFLAKDGLSPAADPLVRLGALHHLRRSLARDELQSRLRGLLKGHDVTAIQLQPPEASLFPLHAAVALAQEGDVEGIRWIVRFVTGVGPGHERLGFTALRNCREFPLVVLLASSTTARSLPDAYRLLGGLEAFSDSEASALAETGDGPGRAAVVASLDVTLASLAGHLRDDRRLARATVISRPLPYETGDRYTGFLVVEEGGAPYAVPYHMVDLINRTDGAGRTAGSDLLRSRGRQALVTYGLDGETRAQSVYALPFTEPARGLDSLLARMAVGCVGLTLGVVVAKWGEGERAHCRIIMASGRSIVEHGRRAERQRHGSCWLLHASSPKALFTDYCLSPGATGSVLANFFTNAPQYYGVVIEVLEPGAVERRVLLVQPQSGKSLQLGAPRGAGRGTPALWDRSSDGRIYPTFLVDQRIDGECQDCFDTGHRFCDRCSGTGKGTCPDCGGSGKTACGRCEEGQVRLDCKPCAGSGRCFKCDGDTHITCHVCGGRGSYSDSGRTCKKCGGDGTLSCLVCNRGPQRPGECPKCEGTGDFFVPCRTCSGSGLWNCARCRSTGVARCEACDGTLVIHCHCGGSPEVRLTPVSPEHA